MKWRCSYSFSTMVGGMLYFSISTALTKDTGYFIKSNTHYCYC